MPRPLLLALALAGPLAAGCGAGLVYMPHRDEGNRYADRVQDPKVDRCAAQKDAAVKKDCLRARAAAVEFVRKLSVEDQICLEGSPMSDGITRRCKARAFVSDAGSGKVKVEVRESTGTRFKPMQNLWYTEAALADAYLESVGFTLE